ncbi:stage III sporulation protein AE [Scopulibacillus daqui]|uniref:stage III sporulation protein AE n=1 Tax=Scopulibacillus daqui TaxID=1469162 RepID=UPI00196165E4|nr:stage III sporulation protein AE [Scopulibacillus daqui]
MVVLFIVIIFLYFYPHLAHGQTSQQEWVNNQLSELDTKGIQEYWDKVITEYHGFLPESQTMDFQSFLKSDKSDLFQSWIKGSLKYLFQELLANGKLLGMLILLTVFSMILQTIQNAFEHRAVSKVAYAIVYLVLMIFILNSFKVAISYTTDAISTMSHFLLALMPLILALMSSVGGITSAAFFHPIIMLLINISGWLVGKFVLPLLFLSTLLQIVSTLSDHYKVTKLGSLLRNIGVGTLAVFFAIFLGVMSVQGSATAIADGVLIKTAKFLTGNFVPVVGRMFTDATDTIVSASVLLKNTVGLAGLFILVCLIALPLIKVFTIALIYNLAAAILQPLGGGPVIESLSIMGKSMIYVFASLVMVSLMFFLAITIIIASGNLSLMVR